MLSKMYKVIFLLCLVVCSPLAALTLEEKVGQLMIVAFEGREVNQDARRLIEEVHVGGFIYYNDTNDLDSPTQVRQLSEGLQHLSKTKLWICVDQEGGIVRRLKEGFYTMPGNREVARNGRPAMAEEVAYKMGLEMQAVGVNMNLAPVVDVSSNPQTSYIAKRTFGDTPEEVIAYASQALKGYHRAGIVAVLKHFPGYGNVTIDPHADLPIVSKTLEELEQVDLVPFIQLASQADAMMTAHIMVPAIDSTHCATLSKPIIEGILRKKMEYDGLVITDSLVMQGLLNNGYSLEEASIQAIDAGCDLLIFGGRKLNDNPKNTATRVEVLIKVHQALVDAVKNGRIAEERLNQAVDRSLRQKMRYLGKYPSF